MAENALDVGVEFCDHVCDVGLVHARNLCHSTGKRRPDMARLAVIATLLIGSNVLSGCVPVAIGAAGAVAADTIAEDRGKDLF